MCARSRSRLVVRRDSGRVAIHRARLGVLDDRSVQLLLSAKW